MATNVDGQTEFKTATFLENGHHDGNLASLPTYLAASSSNNTLYTIYVINNLSITFKGFYQIKK
jgi:hypothetical protein